MRKKLARKRSNSLDEYPIFVSCHFPVGIYPQLYQQSEEVSPEICDERLAAQERAERARRYYLNKLNREREHKAILVRAARPDIMWNVGYGDPCKDITVFLYDETRHRIKRIGEVRLNLWHIPIKEERCGFINEQLEMIINATL